MIERYTTPKGFAQYPHLKEPDMKFNPEGVFSVTMRFEGMTDELKKLIEKLEAIQDKAFDEAVSEANAMNKKKIHKSDLYFEDEEGNVYLKFKQNAVIKKKDGSTVNAKIAHFDSKGKPIDVNVGRDSVIRLSFTAAPYFMQSTKQVGLSLRPVAVQVIKFNEFGGSSAEDYGFSAEEEGYEAFKEEAPFDSLDEDEVESRKAVGATDF